MTAYVIIQVDIHNPQLFDEYKQNVPKIVEAYGGKYLTRGGQFEVLAGEWPTERTVLLSFPSVRAAKDWYYSPEFRGPKAMRDEAAKVNVFVIEGIS